MIVSVYPQAPSGAITDEVNQLALGTPKLASLHLKLNGRTFFDWDVGSTRLRSIELGGDSRVYVGKVP